MNGGSTVSFDAIVVALREGFNISSADNDNGITIVGSIEIDTVVAGAGADVIDAGKGVTLPVVTVQIHSLQLS